MISYKTLALAQLRVKGEEGGRGTGSEEGSINPLWGGGGGTARQTARPRPRSVYLSFIYSS